MTNMTNMTKNITMPQNRTSETKNVINVTINLINVTMKPKINPIIRLIQPITRQEEENKLNTMNASRQGEDIR